MTFLRMAFKVRKSESWSAGIKVSSLGSLICRLMVYKFRKFVLADEAC
jgi:hypothetical protein